MNSERIEHVLRTVDLDVPDVDVWPAVATRLAERPRLRQRMMVAVAMAAAVSVLVLVEPVRTTVSAWFGIGSTTVQVDPSVPLSRADTLDGVTISSDEARKLLGESYAWPLALGEPQFWFTNPDGDVVAGWRESPTLPTFGSAGVGALLSIVERPTTKIVGSQDDAQFVRIGVLDGLWIEAHVRVGSDGDLEPVGNVLLWVGLDGTERRLESGLDRDAAIAIAETLGTD